MSTLIPSRHRDSQAHSATENKSQSARQRMRHSNRGQGAETASPYGMAFRALIGTLGIAGACGVRIPRPGRTVSPKTRNVGRTHDVVDNKGPTLGTHDVYENK